jgi:hypothetical protein
VGPMHGVWGMETRVCTVSTYVSRSGR